MDLWVVAAAAGAGLAKHWQKKSKETEECSGDFIAAGKSSSQTVLEQVRNKTCPFRRFGRKRIEEEASTSRNEVLGSLDEKMTRLCDSEMVSTSGFDDEMLGNYGGFDGYNILSLSSLAPGVRNKMNNEDKGKMIMGSSEGGGESSDRLPSNCRGGMSSFQSYTKSGSSLRSRRARGFSGKPLSSLESCLVAQLYKEHVEMEEYVFSAFPSPSRQTVRPLVVRDGTRVISRATSDSLSVQLESGESVVYNSFDANGRDVVFGVPHLRPLDMKQKRAKGQVGKISSCKVMGKNFMSQVSPGSANGMFLFCLGITVGVMSTLVANKREVDKLHGLLKQTENLVHDLQEELEMKDSLTVKELPNDDESQETNEHSFHNVGLTSFSSELSSLNYGDKRSDTQKLELEENSEMMKIEAELEAELERLELNMQASSLEGKLYGLDELDPDLVGNIVKGELRPDMVKGGADFRADSDKDASGTSTTVTENVNYAVSPRALSLRLHEVIQSRLEERIGELESELQNSQKRVTLMEYKQQRNYSNGGPRSSSQESLTLDEDNSIAQPLVLNLSGDALDSYNETYEELLGVHLTDEEEEHTPTTERYENQINSEKLHWERNRFSNWNRTAENGSFQQVKVIKERYPTPMSSISDKEKTLARFSRFNLSNEVRKFEEENGDDDYDDDDGDEMGRLLIQKIVEKTKKGSPLVLNAQKLLFSLDEKL
ncbi:hypothetical protein MKW94_018882 [Papaver nudicaule]|uniref:Uncharacterized protein n=1 Tax=Papaver nudicaule TaxID=74823 RepID=A0AA42AXZ0_PAPNU|nr:hypothetical protein [Papaver nudicaule]